VELCISLRLMGIVESSPFKRDVLIVCNFRCTNGKMLSISRPIMKQTVDATSPDTRKRSNTDLLKLSERFVANSPVVGRNTASSSVTHKVRETHPIA
jgi:hypothetical protein